LPLDQSSFKFRCSDSSVCNHVPMLDFYFGHVKSVTARLCLNQQRARGHKLPLQRTAFQSVTLAFHSDYGRLHYLPLFGSATARPITGHGELPVDP